MRTRCHLADNCRRCGRSRLKFTKNRLESRGLCSACRHAVERGGTLDDWPRLTWRGEELVEEYEFLLAVGAATRLQDAAPQLGVTYDALRLAVKRHGRQADLRIAA